MKRFFERILILIGTGVVVTAILAALVVVLSRETLPKKIVLEIDLERSFAEYVPDDALARVLMESTVSVREMVDGLQRAAEDDRVVAIVARMGAPRMGLAEIQEVRDAVLAYRESGKPAVAFAETFGEFGPGNGAYYLASAFDEIYLQPSGDVGLTGLMAESAFFAGTLEKLGVTPRMDQRHEYKNALNMLTEKQYTPPHREAVLQVIASQFGQIVRGIAEGRGLEAERVRGLVDHGPFAGSEAIAQRLIDGLAYRDEVADRIDESVGDDAERLTLSTYLSRSERLHSRGDTIALIYGVGAVQRGESEYRGAFGAPTMGSDSVAAAFRAAAKDDEVKAIIFRIDSPGGSYVASDTIWRATVRAKEAGKPVIVSMGNVAGSGGYFVAAAADKIVAHPGTVTGSIGVLGGKLLTTDLMEKIGITSDEVHTSTNATLWSNTLDYTPEQWQRISAWLDRVYADFTDKVAKGRGLMPEQVHAVAKGRIWTGEDAEAVGLVDALGGFPTAVRLAKQAAGIADEVDVDVRIFPAPKTLFEQVVSRLQGGRNEAAVGVGAAVLGETLRIVRPLVELGHRLGLLSHPGVLTMPAWRTEW